MMHAREHEAAASTQRRQAGYLGGLLVRSAWLAVLGAWGLGCSAQAGMFCLQQSDCRPGLVCNKPPAASRPEHYGICEPARRGSGEICLRSSDCAIGLRCSVELGEEGQDGRHGSCVPASGGGADGGSGDLSDAGSRD
jgi:hypothetical protein